LGLSKETMPSSTVPRQILPQFRSKCIQTLAVILVLVLFELSFPSQTADSMTELGHTLTFH